MAVSADVGAIAFAERLIALLDEGRFTATYKYAVLLGLMDLCLESCTKSGAAPSMVTTRQLAERVLERYWSHTMPFEGTRSVVLRQNSRGQAEIVSLIQAFRDRHAPDPSATLARARTAAPGPFERLVRKIEWKLVEMPLPRLQRMGDGDAQPFIYCIEWSEAITQREFEGADFDNAIRFIGAASDHLVRLAGLLRPLIQREWARVVALFNADAISDARLEAFLFGVERIPTGLLRGPLGELQENRCFYCDARLGEGAEVDHFLPWARYPDNGVDNLVVADRRCNGDKRAHLAAAEHVDRWVRRSLTADGELAGVARTLGWERDRARSVGVARAIYMRLPDDIQLWQAPKLFVPADRAYLAASLGG